MLPTPARFPAIRTTQKIRKAIRMLTAGPAAITATRFQTGWL